MSYIVNRTSGKFEILEFDQMDRIIGENMKCIYVDEIAVPAISKLIEHGYNVLSSCVGHIDDDTSFLTIDGWHDNSDPLIKEILSSIENSGFVEGLFQTTVEVKRTVDAMYHIGNRTLSVVDTTENTVKVKASKIYFRQVPGTHYEKFRNRIDTWEWLYKIADALP